MLSRDVAPGVHRIEDAYTNWYMVEADEGLTIADCGVPTSWQSMHAALREIGRTPADVRAVVLTHAHFDHVGGLRELAQAWDAPVYAHRLELPYLTGRSSYPPPDPTVGGGAMARLSPLYPRGPIDLGERVRALPEDGSVPGLPEWRWLFTPGHTPGHVSLWRERDAVLIAGDAFVTTKQESALSAVTWKPEIHGPPAYFTPDWVAACRSVELLASLEPEIAATGHGPPLRGPEMREGLRWLSRHFHELAVPKHGRYAHRPAITGPYGLVSAPPPVGPTARQAAVGAALIGIAGAALMRSRRG